MGQSVRASEAGLAIADQARQRHGWTKTSTARWWQEAHTSRATLRRFWRRERIQQAAFISICQAVGIEDWLAIAETPATPTEAAPPSNVESHPDPSLAPRIDWGDAPDIDRFYGRENELKLLQDWAHTERARLINISGPAGIGKTSLAVAFAEQQQSEFEAIIWRSAQTLSSEEAWVTELLDHPIETLQSEKAKLLKQLQQRCLIVLDALDWETETPAPYLELLRWLSQFRHQSCVVVISSSPLPAAFQTLNRFQHLPLKGLAIEAALQLLQSLSCQGTKQQLQALARRYQGQPFALKAIAPTIKTVFAGQVGPFLEQDDVTLLDCIRAPLKQQFQQLPLLERSLLFWLVIWQEPVSLMRLQTHLVERSGPTAVIAALRGLVERSLVTQHFGAVDTGDEPAFGLPSLAMQFMLEQLLEAIAQELSQLQCSTQPTQLSPTLDALSLLKTHCLVRPGTDDILGDRVLAALRQQSNLHTHLALLPHLERCLVLLGKVDLTTFGYLKFNLTILTQALI